MKRAAIILLFWLTPAWAVEPSEILADPALEERARSLSQGLRCPICQNESIDESNAALAKELRLVVRERLVAGDSDEDVVAFVVARYGEFVRLRPDTSGANLVLWLLPPALFVLALGVGLTAVRRKESPVHELSDTEKAALDKIMRS